MVNILILSRIERNLELMTNFLSKQGFTSVSALSYDDLDKILAQNDFDIALLDIAGFDSKIWSYCERINQTKKPFFIISPIKNPKIDHESLKKGARGVIVKPLVMKELIELIKAMVK